MSRTFENLHRAFIGESMARNKYTFWGNAAKKEGFQEIGDAFLEIANQETEHAEWLNRLMGKLGETSPITFDAVEAGVPYGDTIANLKSAIAGENHEHTVMYPDFAKIAEEEGHMDIAIKLRNIATAEVHHEGRFNAHLQDLIDGTTFKKATSTTWICRKCGFLLEGTDAPLKCPVCEHEQGYYQVRYDAKL